MKPESEEELAECVRSAPGPVEISGGGTRRGLGHDVQGLKLGIGRLAGITLYEPGALTMVARAGTPLAEIEEALAAENQCLAFEPTDHRKLLGNTGEPTIGGAVACNASGPRRIQAGACRDFLLGVRFVDGQGNIIKSGGRVMKNVTGYDLVKLMAGSHGTLGVLSEISFKVLPAPETASVLLYQGLGDRRAVQAMTAALGSPYGVTGVAHTPRGLDGEPVTMIRIEGFEKSVSYRAKELRELLREYGEPDLETRAAKTRAGWAWVRDVEAFADEPGDIWRISVKPTDGPAVADALRAAGDTGILYDWGGGLVWARVGEGTDARAHIEGIPGHATLVRASAETRSRIPVFHPQPAPVARISAGLRDRFDPRGILNPGRMG
ncbi:MAG: FAD-binding protein [Paracoccaceae bacterium]